VQLAQPPGEPFDGELGHSPADQPQVVNDRGDVGEPVQLLTGHGAVNREPGVAELALREQELTPEQLAAKVRRVASDAVSSVQEAERDFLRGLDEGAGAGVEPAPARDF